MATRILAGSAQALTATFYTPGTEALVDADGAVTVAVTHVNGTVILAAGTATTHVSTGVYSVVIPAQAQPAQATLVWTGTFSGSVRTQTDYVNIVGGFMAELAEIRALDGLGNATQYPTSVLIAKRDAATDLFEEGTGVAWNPHYQLDLMDGDTTYRRAFMPTDQYPQLLFSRRLVLTKRLPTLLLGVKIDDGSGTNLVAQTDVPSGYKLYPGGEIERLITSPGFPRGVNNVQFEYIHGNTRPPFDLKDAFLRYVRYAVLATNGRIPDKAVTVTTEAGTFAIGQANAFAKVTGIADVDAVIARHGVRTPSIA